MPIPFLITKNGQLMALIKNRLPDSVCHRTKRDYTRHRSTFLAIFIKIPRVFSICLVLASGRGGE